MRPKFETRQKLDQYRNNHLSNAHCGTCPIDMAIGKLAKLFRRSGKTF